MRRFALVSAVLFFWGCASAPLPLPSDLRIVPPTSEAVPAERAAFSGLWTGILDSRELHMLVVEEIEGDRAVIVAAFKEGWMRMRAAFEGRALRFRANRTSASGPTVGTREDVRLTYRLESDGALTATLEVNGRIVRGRMTRGGTTTVSAPVAQRSTTATGPLPMDLRVIPPDGSVPKELVALSGHWSGTFETSPIMRKGNLRHVLVVEEITIADAVVVLALDGTADWSKLSGWVRRRIALGNGLLKVSDDKGTLEYQQQPDGSLLAALEVEGVIVRARLGRPASLPATTAINRDFLPLPADTRIVPPGSDAHRELAAFSGQWLGTWEGIPNKHTLVVEEVHGAEAVVVFAATGTPRPVSTRARGIFVDGVLKLLTPRTTITYRMQDDGTVLAIMTTEKRTFRSRMTRVGP